MSQDQPPHSNNASRELQTKISRIPSGNQREGHAGKSPLSETESHFGNDASLHADTDANEPVGQGSESDSRFSHEPSDSGAADFILPETIGRFVVQRRLGQGGFGQVLLGYDPDLDRQIALKVPRSERFVTSHDLDEFIREAKTAARLKHPGIVTMFDILRNADSLVIVQEYVDGKDLRHFINGLSSKLPVSRAVSLIMPIAEAVGFAHESGFVHRDLKPENILLDRSERPLVADFGLAVHETQQRRKRGEISGSPSYMSPEQVRGETHRLDGRSDLWSLGIIFYELLTGRPPFTGKDRREVFEEILYRDPAPLRQRRAEVPHEIDRICLRCLAKRAIDRYPSVHDFMDDLRVWQLSNDSETRSVRSVNSAIQCSLATGLPHTSSIQKQRIVPKGMRSFSTEDSDFFLSMLPGPYDRDGLPASLRFWRTRIQELEAHKTFPIGLLYGPSGCGKSSLMKAGLIPRLSNRVQVVYVEATAENTEYQIQKSFSAFNPKLVEHNTLSDLFYAIREGDAILPGRKLLLVIDQFEQWLYGNSTKSDSQLVDALRHCDGGRLQTIVMVRDDFWSAISRFLNRLEIRTVEGENSSMVDLFSLSHAENVLAMFGQAFGRLSENQAEWSSDQREFLAMSAKGIAVDNAVVPVRLVMLAEMMKYRDWTPQALESLGGFEGVGVAYLRDAFESRNAPPELRRHLDAIPSLLRSLLPDRHINIRNTTRTVEELHRAVGSGYPLEDLRQLIDLLDRRMHLITPTEREPILSGPVVASSVIPDVGYQLTHDYLVPSLREWLNRKQCETRRGRAELKLEERSNVWKNIPEDKQLPSLTEWWTVLRHTVRKNWNDAESRMMRRATRFHSRRIATTVGLLILVVSAMLLMQLRMVHRERNARASSMVDQLISADPDQLPHILSVLDGNIELVKDKLESLSLSKSDTADQARAQFHARLASVAWNPVLVESVCQDLLHAEIEYLPSIIERLRPNADDLRKLFSETLRDDRLDPEHRLRAGLALANYVPVEDSDFWSEQDWSTLAWGLVKANPETQPILRRCLSPHKFQLVNSLERIAASTEATESDLTSVANAMIDYAGDDERLIARQLALANSTQFSILFPQLARGNTVKAIESLADISSRMPTDDLGSQGRINAGKGRANAAIALMRMGESRRAMQIFKSTDDPEALTQFVFQFRDRRLGVYNLLDCLKTTEQGGQDRGSDYALYALLLALGEFSWQEVPEQEHESLLSKLSAWYANHSSAAVHASAGWLLRQWGHSNVVDVVDSTPVAYSADRQWFTLAISVVPKQPESKENTEKDSQVNVEPKIDQSNLASLTSRTPKSFYFTFVVVPAGDYWIGSVGDEPGRSEVLRRELRHQITIERPFALLDREVRFDELIAFWPGFAPLMQQYSQSLDCAAFGCSWYETVAFCRWLSSQHGVPDSELAYPNPATLDVMDFPKETASQASWAPKDWPLDATKIGFRLPTEGEWEVAVRSGSSTAYSFGGDATLLNRFGWYSENSSRKAHPGKLLRPGINGLFDAHGNLAEWVHDWYLDYSDDSTTQDYDSSDRALRCVRGGTWNYSEIPCRSAGRAGYQPADRDDFLGFRIAFTLPPETSKDSENFD